LEENISEGVSFINRENKGAGAGRNAGIDLWNNSTPYVLFVDGGILPPIGGVPLLKDYLIRHPETDVISPEVASCFTTDEKEATLRVNDSIPEEVFWQRCLSSTAYCMTNQRAWDGLRFSEEGPFGEPGWGVDDNDMAFRWDDAGIKHDEFVNQSSGWRLFRKAGGSHNRLFEETGIHPTQYGSVYEKRNVKLNQDWRLMMKGIPSVSYIVDNIPMPIFARAVRMGV
jgi:glycosyltransferase involved in cell wall biosynthesis